MAETRLRRSVASAIVGTLLAAVLVGPADNSVVAAQETALSGGALIRIVHVSPDAGPIDVYVDATPALRDVAFGEVADIRPLPAGTHHIRLVPTRGEDLRIDDLTVKSGEAYELAAFGRVGDDHLSSVLVPIDLAALRTGQARLRVVNAAQGTAALRLRLQGLDLVDRVRFTDASRYATVEAGTYDLEPRAEEPAPWYRPVRSFQASPRTEIQEGLAYSFYAVKRAETGPVQFVKVGTPVRSMRVATIVEGPCGEAGALSVADLQPLLTPGTSSGSDGSQIETSVTTLHGTLVDIFSGVRSLVVDQVDAGGRQRIACGVVGGAPLPGDGALVIGLQEVGGSGDAGVAYLVPDAGGDTTITVFVGELAAGEAETPKIESDELIAEVYAGTCHDHELIPVASLGSVDTPRGPILGSPNAAPVSVAAAIADRTVSELLAHEHVVIIRAVGTDTSEDLACGEILGVRRSDGALIVALRPTSGSMVAGLVYLSPRQDGRTAATVFVGRDLNAPRSRSQTMTTGEQSGAPGPGGGSAPANGETTGQSSSPDDSQGAMTADDQGPPPPDDSGAGTPSSNPDPVDPSTNPTEAAAPADRSPIVPDEPNQEPTRNNVGNTPDPAQEVRDPVGGDAPVLDGDPKPQPAPVQQAPKPPAIVEPVTDVVEPVTKPVNDVVEPVVKPVNDAVEPVAEPVKGAVDDVGDALDDDDLGV